MRWEVLFRTALYITDRDPRILPIALQKLAVPVKHFIGFTLSPVVISLVYVVIKLVKDINL